MNSFITISLVSNLIPIVEKGQKVKSGQVVAKSKLVSIKEKIPLAKILLVDPKKIISHLSQKIGSRIKKGDIIARKSGLFKSVSVKSPIEGTIDSVDLKSGDLFILTREVNNKIEVSPVDGSVDSTDNMQIKVAFEGKLYQGEKGRGKRIVAPIVIFKKVVDMSDFGSEVEGKIVIANSFSEAARSKMGALGVQGLISLESFDDFPSFVQLKKNYLEELVGIKTPQLIVHGDNKLVIIPLA